MKVCEKCSKTYEDDSLNYCLDDGSPLRAGSASYTTADTAVLHSTPYDASPTVSMDMGPTRLDSQPIGYQPPVEPRKSRTWIWALVVLAGVVLLCGGGIVGLGIYGSRYADTANVKKATPSRTPKASPTDDDDTPSSPTPVDSGYTLTMDQYKRISNGMTRAEVEKILGKEGTQLSSSSAGDTTYTVDQWETADYKSIILTFENDKVTTRAQAGLK
jgi:hypothetical protein